MRPNKLLVARAYVMVRNYISWVTQILQAPLDTGMSKRQKHLKITFFWLQTFDLLSRRLTL
jgi:hypothetical protein